MKHLAAEIRKPFFWFVLIVLLVVAVLFYSELLFRDGVSVSDLLGLQRHTIERLLLLVIVAFAAARGLWYGIAYLILTALMMMPHLFFPEEFLADSIFETIAVTIAGAIFIWLFETMRSEKLRAEQSRQSLKALQKDLQSCKELIEENNRRLGLLQDIAAMINNSQTPVNDLGKVCEKIQSAIKADGVLIFSVNKSDNTQELKCRAGISEVVARAIDRIKITDGFNQSVILNGTPVHIGDIAQDSRPGLEVIKNAGFASLSIVPLVTHNEVTGTLCVLMHGETTPSTGREQSLSIIGQELGLALDKSDLIEEKERAGRRFRDLFHNAHDAIWLQDFEGKILAANQATAEYTGYDLKEIMGANVTKFIAPEGVGLAREVRRKLICGEHVEQPYEQKVTRKDGTLATIMLTTSLIMDEAGAPLFQHISRDVTRERRLSENLHLYAQQITRAEEEERKRIARELHDDSIQALILLSRRVDDLTSTQPKRAKITQQLEEIREEIDSILARIRLFTQDLRPPTLDYLGLIPAVRELITQVKSQTGLETLLNVDGEEQHFSPEDELLIYRVIQEALRNVWRHASAKQVIVSIRFNGKDAIVEVRDDGSGFEIGEELRFVEDGKIGLAGMQERADLLGGSLAIQSTPGQGTLVTLRIPAERWKK